MPEEIRGISTLSRDTVPASSYSIQVGFLLYLKVAVAELDRQALLPSMRHGRTVGVNRDGGVPPAGAIKPFVL